MGLSNELSCEAGSFCCCRLNPHRCFQSEVLRLYFPMLQLWVAWSVSLPSCSSRVIRMQMWDGSVLLLPSCFESSLPSCPTPPLLQVWMNVSSLSPWLLGLPYSSIFCEFWLFFVFKLLLSFFWLCEEAQCVYLCLHVGRKSQVLNFYNPSLYANL